MFYDNNNCKLSSYETASKQRNIKNLSSASITAFN